MGLINKQSTVRMLSSPAGEILELFCTFKIYFFTVIRMIQQFPEAAGCPKCKASFSLVEGNTKIPAHAGPTNTRLRAHLGLIVPKKGDVHMRIANQTVSWKPGKVKFRSLWKGI